MIMERLRQLRQTEWGQTALNLVFPQFCKACGLRLLSEENGYFCPNCWEGGPRIERPFCPVCGRPHPHVKGVSSQENFLCGECASGMADRPFTRMVGAAPYRDVIEDAIKRFKFAGRVRLAGPLGELMAETAAAELDCAAYDWLVPVPLHRVRQRERGYNQSLLLAREIAPVFPNAQVVEALRRVRPTRVQSRLSDPEARRANVAGAFAVSPDTRPSKKKVLLIDDVVTTGGTVTECARILRAAGAERVDILSAALTERHAAQDTGR